MREIHNLAIKMERIAWEFCDNKNLKFNLKNVQTISDMEQFKRYAEKRIPEIITEESEEKPVFKAMEMEYDKEGKGRIKNISYT